MTYSQGALWSYLYGQRVEFEPTEDGGFWRIAKGDPHDYNGKTVPTGSFDLPGSEKISAVLFSNAGTVSKFNRMGLRAGFVPERHRYFRIGYRYDPNPDAYVGIPFQVDVLDPQYEEYWSDELQVSQPQGTKPDFPRCLRWDHAILFC